MPAYIKRTILLWLIPCFLFVAPLFSQTKTSESLDDLVHEALQNNPQLKASDQAVYAEKSKIPQAGSLPDPTLNLNLMNLPVNTFAFDQEPMTGKQVGIMQKFPFPGKLGLQEKIATDGASVAQASYDELRNKVIENVKQVYYELYYTDQSILTTQKNSALLQQFEQVAETKYRVGKGLQQDVLKAQVELSKLQDRLINLSQKRLSILARLNTLLNRPADTHLDSTYIPSETKLPNSKNQLVEQTLANRALLKAWQSRKAQSKDKINLAKKDYWPDFAIGVAYTQRDVLSSGMGGVDFLSGGISLNIPLYFWRKQSKKVEESVYASQQTDEMFNNTRNQVLYDLEDSYSDLQKNNDLLELYRNGIIPQASQSLQSAISGYQNDKVDFLTLVNNQMTLFNLELEYQRILSNWHKDIAALEFIVGGSLNEQ